MAPPGALPIPPGGLKALLKREDLSLHYSTMLETTPVSRLMQFELRLSRMKADESRADFFILEVGLQD